MKAEINRRCTPAFSINNSVTKKDKLKDLPADMDDFFKKIMFKNFGEVAEEIHAHV